MLKGRIFEQRELEQEVESEAPVDSAVELALLAGRRPFGAERSAECS